MAAIINGARVEWAGYEFGVSDGELTTPCLDYNSAKAAAGKSGQALVMRALYQTDWMPAK